MMMMMPPCRDGPDEATFNGQRSDHIAGFESDWFLVGAGLDQIFLCLSMLLFKTLMKRISMNFNVHLCISQSHWPH